MRKDNPALTDCSELLDHAHLWRMQGDDTVKCAVCDLALSRKDAIDAFPELFSADHD